MSGKVLEMPTPDAPSVNGGMPAGTVVPRRIEWVTIQTPPYAGMRFRAWINAPYRLTNLQWQEDTFPEFFRKVFIEHDGWRYEDEDGEIQSYPPMGDAPSFLVAVGNELLQIMLAERRYAEVQALPLAQRKPGN